MSTPPSAQGLDIGRVLDEGAWSAFQKGVLLLAALAFAADGLANQVLGLAIPALIGDWHVHKEAFAPVAALGLVGVAVGTALGGIAGDRFGRRWGLIGSTLLFGVMTAVSAFVSNIDELLLVRLLAGLGIGGAIPNGAALIAEFTPLRHRSVAIAIGMVFIPVGGFLSGVLGAALLPPFGWRGFFLVGGLGPTLLAFVFAFVLPESPRVLVRRPHRRSELLALLTRCGYAIETNQPFMDEQASHRQSQLGTLFGPGMLGNTLALWVGFFFCLLASYTMFSWVPTVLASQGFSLAMTSIGTTSFHVGGMIGGLAGGWLIARLGSRIAVVGLAAGCVFGALVLGFLPTGAEHGAAHIVAALIVEGFFIAGLHTGLYTLAAVSYPAFVRASGIGAAAAVGRIGAVASSYTGVITLELGGSASYFIVIAGAAAVALAAVAMITQHIPRRDRTPPAAGDAPRHARA
jgi:MFS transporter, AAHS family, 4-hydroxybenzoate transporter